MGKIRRFFAQVKATLARACVFIGVLFFYHVTLCWFFPVDKNGVLLAPKWYYPLGFLLALFFAIFIDKIYKPKKTEYTDYEYIQTTEFVSDFSEPAGSSQNSFDYEKMRNEEVIRLNKTYDFNTIEGINSIPVPCYEVNGASITGRVEYYLRGQCFFSHWEAGRTDLALCCLKKAQELMFVSDMIWKRYDFLRLVQYLYKCGKWDEAEEELRIIDNFFEKQKQEGHPSIQNCIDRAKICKTDLIEAYSHAPYCSKCAKYVNRVYSISGKTKKFPKLPDEFFIDPSGHYLQCLSVTPFMLGISDPVFKCKNIARYSNRPFVDERSAEQIARSNAWQANMAKLANDQIAQEHGLLERAKLDYIDGEKFKWIQENLPDICPKSISGFRRMRSMNTSNYQRLVSAAKSMGYDL